MNTVCRKCKYSETGYIPSHYWRCSKVRVLFDERESGWGDPIYNNILGREDYKRNCAHYDQLLKLTKLIKLLKEKV